MATVNFRIKGKSNSANIKIRFKAKIGDEIPTEYIAG
jgi:hypothetical protein